MCETYSKLKTPEQWQTSPGKWQTSFCWCFSCLLWTSKCILDSPFCQYLLVLCNFFSVLCSRKLESIYSTTPGSISGKWQSFINHKKCFLFHLFFYFRYSNFSPEFFGCDVKRLIFKIYDAINWETYGYNTVLPNISRSKSNQTMKFGLLIEYEK